METENCTKLPDCETCCDNASVESTDYTTCNCNTKQTGLMGLVHDCGNENSQTSESSSCNEPITLNVGNDLVETTFSYVDTSSASTEDTESQNLDETNFKYTKVDCLNEDPVIPGQKFALLTFISPHGIMNCNVNGLMVRGVYPTLEEAEAAVALLKKKDPYFDIFIGEVGKWLPWNPSSRQVEKVKYRNKKLDKIMKTVHENDMKSLNEVVGRYKEMRDKDKDSHKKRIEKSIKESVDTMDDQVTSVEEEKQHVPKKSVRNADSVRQRLRKTMEERDKNKASGGSRANGNNEQSHEISKEEIAKKKELVRAEAARLSEQNKNIGELEQKTTLLDEKLKKMREMYNQKKK